LKDFHPAIQNWFYDQFDQPTQPQLDAWRAISSDNHALVAAPTGSGKTLAAFLTAIDGLVKQAVEGALGQEVSVVYVSPLKALSNDIQRNLQNPLQGIQEYFDDSTDSGVMPLIQAMVRTGDTTQSERAKMIRNPPHILVTTPESLYILLTSESGRSMLSTARTLIIDEIHALVPTKRGAHLALSMERLQGLCSHPLTRIGLSATQEPIETVTQFLTGLDPAKECQVINSGHQRNRDLQICLPESRLEAVMAGEVWSEIYSTLEALIEQHQTTLIFVNTRRLAERLAKALAERLGDEAVTSHHGSLAKEHRFSAEQRLKTGQLKALVATASLELGIDIGDIDLVCQIGSPRAVSVFLQRVGRSGHSLGKVPKGRLFPLSRDDLVECVALLDAVAEGELDQLSVYPQPLDVLAQQIVAEVAAGELILDELYQWIKKASPYQNIKRKQFDDVITMLADGFSTRRGRRSAYLHLDSVNARIRPRKGARLTAITNGGTIPDQFDYDVILQPEGLKIGTLNEDFSFESLPGDIFQLGNTSYQILKVELGKVLVRDAKGQPPNIPFWVGEAPGRTDAMSHSVSRLRANLESWLGQGIDEARKRVKQHYNIEDSAVTQLVEYLGAAYSALGALPTRETVIFERFFDEAGDQHLVIHSAFGSRVNRAWGLALRKRFCRKFNFELQAAALEDTIVLSLGSTHSFPLEEPASYLKSASVEDVLTQALLDAPMFPTHWRWNASIALAIRRFSNGSRTPPQFQRSNAEDLVAVVFPDQIACAENLAGRREIPDHPLIAQTLHDCLNDLMDVSKLKEILDRLDRGEIRLVCKDLTAPSPLSEEVLTAKPYAFLDNAPAEERQTALVRTRQFLHPEDAITLGLLDQEVVDEVRKEAWPSVASHDECHDALLILGGVSAQEVALYGWRQWLDRLVLEQRACQVSVNDRQIWVAAERLSLWLILHPDLTRNPVIEPVGSMQGVDADSESINIAVIELIRMRLQGTGPVFAEEIADFLQLSPESVSQGLLALEQEGYAMRGKFEEFSKQVDGQDQWCERGLLARIHRRTIKNLRKQIQPVSVSGFMRYLFQWQGLDGENHSEQEDPESLAIVLQQLEGIEVSAGAWEESVLPARLNGFMSYWLDILCTSGRFTWLRLNTPNSGFDPSRRSNKQSPITLCPRQGLVHWQRFSKQNLELDQLSSRGRQLYELLSGQGAQFFGDLLPQVDGLPMEVEHGLAELVTLGLVTSDNYAGLRALTGTEKSSRMNRGRKARTNSPAMEKAGRWSLIQGNLLPLEQSREPEIDSWESVEYIAKVLLRRYGIVFRRILDTENSVPSWRELHYVYRRMEARGEVRGGRFVDGQAGEQFALPEAVGLLRKMAKQEDQTLVSISAADPLNLTGTILPGDRVASIRKNRILFRSGKPIATLIAGEINWLEDLDQASQWQAHQKLIKNSANPPGKYRYQRPPAYH
jgi:ATP-dependent Lhr-like helicase